MCDGGALRGAPSTHRSSLQRSTARRGGVEVALSVCCSSPSIRVHGAQRRARLSNGSKTSAAAPQTQQWLPRQQPAFCLSRQVQLAHSVQMTPHQARHLTETTWPTLPALHSHHRVCRKVALPTLSRQLVGLPLSAAQPKRRPYGGGWRGGGKGGKNVDL